MRVESGNTMLIPQFYIKNIHKVFWVDSWLSDGLGKGYYQNIFNFYVKLFQNLKKLNS